jgi:hypothetical protein
MVTHGADANAPDVAEMAFASCSLLDATDRARRQDDPPRRLTKRIPNWFGAIAIRPAASSAFGSCTIGMEFASAPRA